MARDVSNSADVIDSRDVIRRIEELESELEGLEFKFTGTAAEMGVYLDSLEESHTGDEPFDRDAAEEYLTLKALADEAEGCADWSYGEALIRESYFVEYCQQLCEDIGDIPRNMPAYLVIDWEATSKNLRADYSEVDFGGETYLIRS